MRDACIEGQSLMDVKACETQVCLRTGLFKYTAAVAQRPCVPKKPVSALLIVNFVYSVTIRCSRATGPRALSSRFEV